MPPLGSIAVIGLSAAKKTGDGWNRSPAQAFRRLQLREEDMRSFIIGALVVAAGVLGYLYWDSHYNTVVKAPGVEIKKN